LNRLTWYYDAGDSAASRPLVRIDNDYDANGNVRRTKAQHLNIGATGLLANSTTEDYWYRYDALNRFVTTKGQLVSGAIVRGTTGVDLTYDAAGQRVTATQNAALTARYWAYDPSVSRVREFERPYDGARRETYSYDNAGFMTAVDVAQTSFTSNGNGPITVGTGFAADVRRGQYDRDLMGRIASAVDYAEDGVTAIRQRSEVVYYDGTTQLHSDRVTTREGVATELR
jgi:hypothetical protein